MGLASSKSKRTTFIAATMMVIAGVGVGAGLYLNSGSVGGLDTRSSAHEETTCVPKAQDSCTTNFGDCSATGKKTCSTNATWGACKAVDPRIANCKDKECGDDKCGGVCGTCETGSSCSVNGKCVEGLSDDNSEPKQITVNFKLQERTNYTTEKVLLELYAKGELLDSTTVAASNSGETEKWEVAVGSGEVTIRVKPANYLSQTLVFTLAAGENTVTFDEEFLAGDLVGKTEETGDDVVKSIDLAYLTGKIGTDDDLADLNKDGTVNETDSDILEGNMFKQGESI